MLGLCIAEKEYINIKMTRNFKEADIVFAQKVGYLPWPAKVLAINNDAATVQFLSTNDRHQIRFTKIWPYNKDTKCNYITCDTLAYEEFYDAIFIAERLLGRDEHNIFNMVCTILHPGENPDTRQHCVEPKQDTSSEQLAQSKPLEQSEKLGQSMPLETGVTELAEAGGEPEDESYADEVPVAFKPEKLVLNDNENEAKYVQFLLRQWNSLEVERQFQLRINFLRSIITIRTQKYMQARVVFKELMEIPVSQLLLLRNFEAVNSIRKLCNLNIDYSQRDEYSSEYVKKMKRLMNETRGLAKELLDRFITVFQDPTTLEKFWRNYVLLVSVYDRFESRKRSELLLEEPTNKRLSATDLYEFGTEKRPLIFPKLDPNGPAATPSSPSHIIKQSISPIIQLAKPKSILNKDPYQCLPPPLANPGSLAGSPDASLSDIFSEENLCQTTSMMTAHEVNDPSTCMPQEQLPSMANFEASAAIAAITSEYSFPDIPRENPYQPTASTSTLGSEGQKMLLTYMPTEKSPLMPSLKVPTFNECANQNVYQPYVAPRENFQQHQTLSATVTLGELEQNTQPPAMTIFEAPTSLAPGNDNINQNIYNMLQAKEQNSQPKGA